MGILNANTINDFEKKLRDLINEKKVRLIIDFTAVPYVSSRGWGILISLLKVVRRSGGDIKIVGMRPNVTQLFWYAGLSNIFETYEDRNKAIAVFASSKPSTA
jgi:anti-sigma B factor antagonist